MDENDTIPGTPTNEVLKKMAELHPPPQKWYDGPEEQLFGMIKVFAQCDCGCCVAEMQFNDVASAQKAFAAVGLTNGATIKDDAGVEHEGIDTFYPFSTEREEFERPSLQRLAEQVWLM